MNNICGKLQFQFHFTLHLHLQLQYYHKRGKQDTFITIKSDNGILFVHGD